MKKTLVFLALCACAAMGAHAQNEGTDYRTALGFKYFPAGVTVKRFLGRHTALEALGYSHDGFRFTALVEYYIPIAPAAGLNAYLGPGAHVGFHNELWKEHHPDINDRTVYGVDGVVGIDYKMKGVPLNLSIDWQPSYNFTTDRTFEGGWGGIGIRFAF
ncbi:hypothetical protein EPD60_14195 [Flaviaesturariibacter flavus]|uniref:Outer membrane protein beta-barrel domain-containing protein n=1 Tax=Flaviaesturariibacter flavus TaxID=2502780 RepID=A0A4R1B306_9BACT|nr:hypothetical protein [Flaviaesturariibacter flavus]TCJ12424.1 hypothetical protein EPD60_14195 [Flaviaesturariibacter flavus]